MVRKANLDGSARLPKFRQNAHTKVNYMSDNLSKTGKPDDIRVNIHQDHEVRYWSQKLGVTPERLKQVVHVVGPMVKDVKRHLGINN